MDTMSILQTSQKILLNTLGTGVFGAELTDNLPAENCRIGVRTNGTEFGDLLVG